MCTKRDTRKKLKKEVSDKMPEGKVQVAYPAHEEPDEELFGTSPLKDSMLMLNIELLDSCQGKCSECHHQKKCQRTFDRMSGRSSHHALSRVEAERYLLQFTKFVKSEKLECIFVFLFTGAILCGSYYGVSLPLPSVRHSLSCLS